MRNRPSQKPRCLTVISTFVFGGQMGVHSAAAADLLASACATAYNDGVHCMGSAPTLFQQTNIL